MLINIVEETKSAVMRYFPERQIYLRSGGEVSYYVLKTRTQVIATTIAGITALWCLITLFNLIWGHNPLAGNFQQSKVIEAEYERILQETESRLETAEHKLTQQQQDFEQYTRSMQDKHRTIAQAYNQPVLNTSFPQLDILGVQKSSLLRAPQIRDSAPRQSRIGEIASREVELGANVDTPLMNLEANQNDILVAAELDTLEKIEASRAIIEATNLNVDDVLRAGGFGTGGPLMSMVSDDVTDQRVGAIQARVAESKMLEDALESVPLGFPVDGVARLTSSFGVRKDPFTRRPAMHQAVDIGSGMGAPIVATADGTVIYSGHKSGYGKVVIVDHGHGFKTKYAHMSKTLVKKGQTIKTGDNVGEMGSTGRSTGPHLHYEILFQDRAYDPDKFLKAGLYVQ